MLPRESRAISQKLWNLFSSLHQSTCNKYLCIQQTILNPSSNLRKYYVKDKKSKEEDIVDSNSNKRCKIAACDIEKAAKDEKAGNHIRENFDKEEAKVFGSEGSSLIKVSKQVSNKMKIQKDTFVYIT